MLTIKKSNFLLILLAAIGLTTLLVVSCNRKVTGVSGRGPVLIDIPKDNSGLDKIDHFIDSSSIQTLKLNFARQQRRFEQLGIHVPVSEAFNKRALLSLLKANDCVGIRIYQGAKTARNNAERSELRLVLVAVDSKGNEILISRNSVLSAKIVDEVGGMESGQCPSCLADFQ